MRLGGSAGQRMTEKQKSNLLIAGVCLAFFGGMVGMAYASVPLYKLFCQVTGYGGTTQRVETYADRVLDRTITIRFDANVAGGLPWEFQPEAREMTGRIGETLQEREAGQAVEVVSRQVAGSLPASLAGKAFAVAYEPVWAIGTGLTPTLEQIEEVHAAVRAAMIAKLGDGGRVAPILYGGSVKPSNAKEILAVAEVGGALVGGASLKAEDFLGIIRAV